MDLAQIFNRNWIFKTDIIFNLVCLSSCVINFKELTLSQFLFNLFNCVKVKSPDLRLKDNPTNRAGPKSTKASAASTVSITALYQGV